MQEAPAAGFLPVTRTDILAKRCGVKDESEDSNDEFNAKHDLARFSHLPGHRNPWRDPYWFRTEFRLASVPPGRRLWLHFDALT